MRVKAGGGGNKEDGEDNGDASSNGSDQKSDTKKKGSQGSGAGGAEAVGRVNNLVGTDVDVITSSLVSLRSLQTVPSR